MSEDSEDSAVAFYLRHEFQSQIVDNYNVNHQGLLYDDKICLMIYTLEWFKIPKQNPIIKIKMHPYLIKKDLKKIDSIIMNHNLNLGYLFFGTFVILNFLPLPFKKSKINLFNRKFGSIFLSGLATYLYRNHFALPNLMGTIENDENLKKYTHIDIDKNKILEELKTFGVSPKNHSFL